MKVLHCQLSPWQWAGRTRDQILPCCWTIRKDLDRALTAANRQPQISGVWNSVTNQPGNSSWAGWQWPQHCHTHSYLLNCFVVTSRHVLDHTFTNISLLLSKELTVGLLNIRTIFLLLFIKYFFFCICRHSPFLLKELKQLWDMVCIYLSYEQLRI